MGPTHRATIDMATDNLRQSRVFRTHDNKVCVKITNSGVVPPSEYCVLVAENVAAPPPTTDSTRHCSAKVPHVLRRVNAHQLTDTYVAQHNHDESFIVPNQLTCEWDVTTSLDAVACTCPNWAYRGVSHPYSRLHTSGFSKSNTYLRSINRHCPVPGRITVPANNLLALTYKCKHMNHV